MPSTATAPAGRRVELPQMTKPKPQAAPTARVESRMCPHCNTTVQLSFSACKCCGVSVCTACLATNPRYCQTCTTLGVPRQEPQWLHKLRQQHQELAKVKRYHVSANQRYGVVHWKGFYGEKLVVFDLWQQKVVAERRGGLLGSLRPKA